MKYSRDLSRPLAESRMDVDRSKSKRGKSRAAKTQYDKKVAVDSLKSKRGKSRAAKTQYDNKVAPVGLKVSKLPQYKDADSYSYLREKRFRKQINKSK